MTAKPTHEERASDCIEHMHGVRPPPGSSDAAYLAAQFAEVETLVEERMVDREEVGEMNDRIAALEAALEEADGIFDELEATGDYPLWRAAYQVARAKSVKP